MIIAKSAKRKKCPYLEFFLSKCGQIWTRKTPNRDTFQAMQTSSIIPTCVSYGHTKFSDNLSDLAMEDVGGIGQRTLKGDFWIKKYHFLRPI